ncbi:glycosyltransferase family 4 protein [Terriglobus albidus]|uniref:Glycosyltransferase family 4 protein n=1 Tax=Terriglobus albidus TaxID=1592106 RepID=A0A5B9EEX6_9BACT|nr:glycosyltransferase family 4 protein [Terriglobus albidus]QEE28606.1 glycosyltransferase family 4 protein [Terriglobus albidus]
MTKSKHPLLLFAAPYFAPAYHGGVVQIYLGLLTRLKRYRVIVVGDRSNTSLMALEEWDTLAKQRYGLDVERIDAFEFHMGDRKMGPLGRLVQLARFLRHGRRQWQELCKKYSPDAVVCGGTYSAGWLMKNLPRRTALVNYIHGEELTMAVKPRFLAPYMHYWQHRCIRRADMNLSVSSYTAHLVSRMTGAPVEKSKILSNFIDLNRFYISGKRAELRAGYGWQEKTVLLTVARLEKRKGIDQVLRGLDVLRRQEKLSSSWRYVIGGKGPERDALVQLVKELELTEYVEFLGFVPDEDLPGLYESADVFVQPNREINGDTEGFGVVFLEANACGLPVIGGEAGGTADAIGHGRTGFRVNGELVYEIAAAISILMENDELRTRLGQQAVEWAANFDVNKAVHRFENLMDEALFKHGAAPKNLTSVSADI